MARCELTHLGRQPLDPARAERQHAAYEACLAALGCRVERLPADPELPDCVFIEDTAIVLAETAVITRPGAASRQPETAVVAEALSLFRPLEWIEAPAALDGGDVLCVGRTLFVGRSGRSNDAGAAQLAERVRPFGYTVTTLAMSGCLHLKTAVTAVADDTLLVHRPWVDTAAFAAFRLVDVDPAEPMGANALRIGDTLVYPSAFPRTLERLTALGLDVRTVDVTELAKAEGAVTCCSLIFTA
jgi:dimethylargininase